jgi:hypothetical protein
MMNVTVSWMRIKNKRTLRAKIYPYTVRVEV